MRNQIIIGLDGEIENKLKLFEREQKRKVQNKKN